MKKAFTFIALITLTFISVSAQTISVANGSSNATVLGAVKQKKIDDAFLRCQYDYRWIKDTTNDTVATDIMLLEIGKNVSKFYSYKTFQADSLISVSTADEVIANPEKFIGGSSDALYKNHPSGKTTLTDKLGISWFSYEEETPDFGWEIGDETKEILGYQAQMATCTFRGRDYVAWFTPEIAVSEGPWKFRGLPGLILDVADTQNHYSYVITGVQKCEDMPINLPEQQYMKTTREKYLQTLRRAKEDPIGFITQNSKVRVTVKNPDGTELYKGNVNKEGIVKNVLNYDFIERGLMTVHATSR